MTEINVLSISVSSALTIISKALGSLISEKTCTAEEAFEEICKDAIKSDKPRVLYASLGTAEVTVLLSRRYMEQSLANASPPRICRIIAARMSDNIIDALLNQGLLPEEFKMRLQGNLVTLKSLCSQHNISFEESYWQKLPIFHGFIYGNTAYIGRWTVGNIGVLSHDTPLYRFSGKKHIGIIDAFRTTFPSAETNKNLC